MKKKNKKFFIEQIEQNQQNHTFYIIENNLSLKYPSFLKYFNDINF